MDRRVERRQHSVDILAGLVVPETNDCIAFSLKPSRAFGIARRVFVRSVLRTVHLDNQTRSQTRKIDNVRSNRDLSSEMAAGHWEPTQPSPELIPGIGGMCSQTPCGLPAKGINGL